MAAPSPALPPPAAEAATQTVPTFEEPEFLPEPEAMPRRPRREAEAPPNKTALWWGIGLGGGLLLLTAGIAAYLLLFTSPPPKKGPPPRGPLRVTAAVAGGLGQVMRQQARDGDRIILEVDITEADIAIDKANLTIEGAPGKKITWKLPAGTQPAAKLLSIQARAGFTLKGVTLDGDGRAEGLLLAFGLCEGMRLEDVEMRGGREWDLMFANTAGTAEKPVTLQGVRFLTQPGRPAKSSVRFAIYPSHKTIRTNDHILFRDCTFEGPGRKLSRMAEGDVGKGVLLPAGLNVETVP